MHHLSRAPARLRITVARRPLLRRGVVVGLAVLAGWSALSWSARIEAERERWGESVEVLVARADVSAGADAAASLDRRTVPVAIAPPAAVSFATQLDGVGTDRMSGPVVARRAIVAGAIVTELDLATSDGPGALLGPDEVAVALSERIRSGARVGDHVMVVSDGFVLVDTATVVAVHDDRVMVAVDEQLAAGVAAAALGPAGVAVLVRP